MKRAWIVVAATCALGCAGTPRPRVEVPVAPHWSIPAEPQADAQPVAAGWQHFACPELHELLQLAAKQNLDNLSADARAARQAALERVDRAALYPALDARMSIAGQSDNGRSLGNVRGGFYEAGLTASYETDLWGRQRDRAEAAHARTRAGDYDRASAQLAVAAEVAQIYFEVLALRGRMASAKVNLEVTQRVLELVEAKARAGMALAREVSQQKALVASEAARVEQLAQAEAEARVALAITVGREPNAIAVRGESLDGVAEPSIGLAGVETPAKLLAHRPEVARAEAELAANHADVQAARAALWPQLRLEASAAFQSIFLSRYDDGSGVIYSAMASLTQPLIDGGARSAERDAAAARRNEAEAEYRRVVLAVVGEVERALRAVDGLEKQHAQQRVVLDEARRAFQLIEIEYKAGAEELLSVLDAQRTLFEVEDELYLLRLAKLRANVSLVKALGAGWSHDG